MAQRAVAGKDVLIPLERKKLKSYVLPTELTCRVLVHSALKAPDDGRQVTMEFIRVAVEIQYLLLEI